MVVPFAMGFFIVSVVALALVIASVLPDTYQWWPLDLSIVAITLTAATPNNALGGISFTNPVTNFNGEINNLTIQNLQKLEVSLSRGEMDFN